jgi:hypothetical protein
MHGCLMPSLFSQGELLILVATHKLWQDFRTNSIKEASRNTESCHSERKSFAECKPEAELFLALQFVDSSQPVC